MASCTTAGKLHRISSRTRYLRHGPRPCSCCSVILILGGVGHYSSFSHSGVPQADYPKHEELNQVLRHICEFCAKEKRYNIKCGPHTHDPGRFRQAWCPYHRLLAVWQEVVPEMRVSEAALWLNLGLSHIGRPGTEGIRFENHKLKL